MKAADSNLAFELGSGSQGSSFTYLHGQLGVFFSLSHLHAVPLFGRMGDGGGSGLTTVTKSCTQSSGWRWSGSQLIGRRGGWNRLVACEAEVTNGMYSTVMGSSLLVEVKQPGTCINHSHSLPVSLVQLQRIMHCIRSKYIDIH